ncbi:MAG: hypothetical protein R2854_23775 [Caldilineaceae bacterium]
MVRHSGCCWPPSNAASTRAFYVTRSGYGLMEMAYGAWSLVHGMAMLRIGHLTHFPMDYTAAERENLRRLGLGLMAQDAVIRSEHPSLRCTEHCSVFYFPLGDDTQMSATDLSR